MPFSLPVRRSTLIGAACTFALVALPVGIAYAADADAAIEAPLAYDLTFTQTAPTIAEEPAPPAAPDPASLECLAKVVHHESRGQPRRGQLAVAQTVINRMHDVRGRFGDSVCAVANQRGQFFNTHAYAPRRDGDDWAMALDVAREALTEQSEPAAPGAMFFHAAYRTPSTFFRSRQRVTAIAGQVFYR